MDSPRKRYTFIILNIILCPLLGNLSQISYNLTPEFLYDDSVLPKPHDAIGVNDTDFENTSFAVDDFLYFDFYDSWDILEPGETAIYLERPDTFDYLNSFSDKYQRYLIQETLRYCPYLQMCNFSLGLTPPPVSLKNQGPCCKYCSCNPDCVKEMTCCPDYRGIELQPMFKSPIAEVEEKCMLTQIRYHLANETYEDRLVKAYQSCPEETNNELRSRCSDDFQNFRDISFEDVIPLSNIQTMKTYRNKHCAKCNGVDLKALLSWDLELKCRFQPTITNTNALLLSIINGTLACIIQLQHPISMKIKLCSMTINMCNVTGLWKEYDPDIESGCYYFEAMIEQKNDKSVYWFKNSLCAICNGITPKQYLCEMATFGPAPIFPFSGLLSYSEPEQESKHSPCTEGSIFDDIAKRCKKVTCSPYRVFKENRCDVLLEAADKAGYRVTFLLKLSRIMEIQDIYILLPHILSEVENILKTLEAGYICARQVIIIARNASEDSNLSVNDIDLQYDLLVNFRHDIAEFVDSLLNLEKVRLKINESTSDTTMFTLYLKDESVYYDIPYEGYSNWTVSPDIPIELDELLFLSFVVNNKIFVPYFRWNEYRGPCKARVNIHRLLALQSCPLLSINQTEFGLIDTQYGLTFEGGKEDLTIPLSRYYKSDTENEVFVCLDTYKETIGRYKRGVKTNSLSAETILSVIFVTISILCLLISLLAYCVLQQLRTLPGINNMALIATLFLAQFTYLISSYAGFDSDSFLCKLFGGLTHFLWLQSVFWMNACTYHMFRVLLQTRSMSSSFGLRKHFYYHMYCIGISLIFVVANILESILSSDYIDVGYGKERCYINEQRMVEITFGIPVAVIIVANISMFIAVIIKLKRAPTVSKNVKNDRNYLFVFAKLSTITGATWLFGFIYMWTGVLVFSYSFIILNGGQGIFLMLAFICNKRTFALLKSRKESLTSSSLGQTRSTTVSNSSGGNKGR